MRIELAEPTEADSSLHRHIGSSTGGIYHVCFEVDDLEGTVLDWRRRGAFPVTKPAAAAIFDGRRTVFMRTPDRLLTELVEAPASEAA
jgi:catechol 2,3-dioxygenase-like lactoylglutathione lyase family enzyme